MLPDGSSNSDCLAKELGPAALQILVEHVAVDHPEAIPLAEIFDFNDGGHGSGEAAVKS